MTVETTPQPKEIHTRFLYPFFFERNAATRAFTELSKASIESREGRNVCIWECPAPPSLYKEELLDHVEAFLFQNTTGGCKYLRLSGAAANRWFNKVRAVLSEPKQPKTELRDESALGRGFRLGSNYVVHLNALSSVEIFLSNYGVGLLSIALTPTINDLNFGSASLFNYRFSQLRPQVTAKLCADHPAHNDQIWSQMSPQQREEVPPLPDSTSTLDRRLGCAGGSFTLSELINDVMLRPLNALGLAPAQNQLSVYTVLRFGEEVDLERSETRTALAPFLSAISQIEEPTHAGAPSGVAGVTNAILNRRHWAGIGSLGMAHIVADQPEPEASFNEQRVPRVHLKYFIPYLVALLQRTALHRTISEASRIALSHEDRAIVDFAALRRQIVEFALTGYFPEVSNREVIQRYYEMAQKGLGVSSAFEIGRRAISDIDAQFTLDRQVKLAEAMAENVAATRGLQEKMTEHLNVVAKVQMTVEWIEIFVVSVYLAHLWYMFATHIDALHGWISYGIILAAVVGALGAAAVLRPWGHQKHRTD